MRAYIIWCLVMALAHKVCTEEKSEEKSRQFLFDYIPTQPPIEWPRPATPRPSLLSDWRKTLLSWLPDWLTNTEPPVLYPVPGVPSYFRNPTRPPYNPQQYYPRPYQGYRPAPQLSPAAYRPGPQLPPAGYAPQVPLYGYRPGPQLPLYQQPPSLYGQVGSQLPYSGETAPFPSYNPSGVGAASAPRPVYKEPPSQANVAGNYPQKPAGNQATEENVQIYPVYKGPTGQVNEPEVPTSNIEKKPVVAPEGFQTSQMEQPSAEYIVKPVEPAQTHGQPAPEYMVNPAQPVYVPSQQDPQYMVNPAQPVYVPSQQDQQYMASLAQPVQDHRQPAHEYVANPAQPVQAPGLSAPDYVVNPAQLAASATSNQMNRESMRHHGPPHTTNLLKGDYSQQIQPDPTGEAIEVVPAPDLSKEQRVMSNRP